ncbi:phosphoribosylanthranilate isomerase [Spongiivirga sp. MCCC 1A20706]|uniref:phosphoribosylanthranilate isomerase n=1 Tax=Spongiivirga sp. MCCC 1A20706 TaxID=3160963 RepID=UPI003977658B
MKNVKLKICGMRHPENIQEVASLHPDYLGFIFYEKSPRNFEGIIPKIPQSIKKVGVFVDANIDFIKKKINQYNLDIIQLHGDESVDYIKELKTNCLVEHSRDLEAGFSQELIIWKVFSIKDEFDFELLKLYDGVVDAFLFDTKGKQKGGNGYTFNWNVLKEYNSKTPIVLSGGIGLDELTELERILKTNLPIQVIDVNSKLEESPGLKSIKKVKEFVTRIKNIEKRKEI